MDRLQKVMAAAGVGSRRKCEQLIAQGRVRVNGEVVRELGTKVAPGAEIMLDGKRVEREKQVYYLLNKPAGFITTARDTHGRPTVMELVPHRPRVWPVGRLDLDTEGLLLLTNDGELTHLLLHPSREVPKTYRAHVSGRLSRHDISQLEQGLELADGITAPARVRLLAEKGNTAVVDLTIFEGRKRQVKRMFAAVGCRVMKLERVRFDFLSLEGVPRGAYRVLTRDEVERLKKKAARGSKT